ncbi:MAG: hypothetical protein QM602_05730 [Microbacterium sp.]
MSKARIAERLGISRTTVLKAVRSESPPRYERTPAESSFVAFEPRVRAMLAERAAVSVPSAATVTTTFGRSTGTSGSWSRKWCGRERFIGCQHVLQRRLDGDHDDQVRLFHRLSVRSSPGVVGGDASV